MKYYYYLKKDIEILETSFALKGGNPFVPWFNLFFGVISICLTISWLLHIILYMLPNPPIDPFLNTFFIALEEAFGANKFGLLGVLAFAIYSYYLLACAVKGNFKLGLRFFIWKVNHSLSLSLPIHIHSFIALNVCHDRSIQWSYIRHI
jgi:LMBR1 domain-containing protein 1